MADFAAVGAVVIAALLVFGGILYWLIVLFPRDRLMRCPETGSITFVGAELASRGNRKEPEVMVRQCKLWPERKDCAQGCRARYWESGRGFQVNLEALRPLERQ